jgi:hypothetical protein
MQEWTTEVSKAMWNGPKMWQGRRAQVREPIEQSNGLKGRLFAVKTALFKATYFTYNIMLLYIKVPLAAEQ